MNRTTDLSIPSLDPATLRKNIEKIVREAKQKEVWLNPREMSLYLKLIKLSSEGGEEYAKH